jgi:membrane associated rhomboid family serine protease
MPTAPPDLLEYVLHQCLNTAPRPWYPSTVHSIPRDLLDSALDQLRMGDLVSLTDWVPDRGQGYVLTREGHTVLHNPGLLGRLRHGDILTPHTPGVSPTPLAEEGPPSARADAVAAALSDRRKPIVTRTILGGILLLFLVGLWLASQRNIRIDTYLWGDMQVADLRGDPDAAKKVKAFKEAMKIRHELGAMYPNDVLVEGQVWRLVTYSFVQGGLLQLLLNLYFLYSLARQVEAMFGRWRFAIVYLVSILGGGVAALLYGDPEPTFPVMGAFGAVCGLLGSLGVWALCNRPYLPREVTSALIRSVISSVIFIAVFSLLMPGSNAPSVGSGLAGAAISLPLVYHRFERGVKRALGLAGTFAVPLVLVGLVYWSNPETFAAESEENTKLAQQADETIQGILQDQKLRTMLKNADRRLLAADRLKSSAERVAAARGKAEEAAGKMSHGTARSYVQTGAQVLDSFQRSLDPELQARWTDDDEDALHKLVKRMDEFRDKWRQQRRREQRDRP